MWLGIHWCHSLPLWLVYSPHLLICLQGEDTIGRERGPQNQTFPTVSADHSLETHKIPSRSPPSAVWWVQPAATFCLPSPFTRGWTLQDTWLYHIWGQHKTNQWGPCPHGGNHHRHTTFRTMAGLLRAVFQAAMTYGSFARLMKCTPYL